VLFCPRARGIKLRRTAAVLAKSDLIVNEKLESALLLSKVVDIGVGRRREVGSEEAETS
jgi:hypothetical protein